MRRLDHYVAAATGTAMAIVLLVLLGVINVFRFLAELDNMGGDYGFADIAWFVVLTTPRHLYDLIPYTVMIGALVGLGSLATTSELTVMRAAGISTLRIALAAMRPAIILVIAGFLVGEHIMPPAERLAQLQKQAKTGNQRAQPGEWYRDGDLFIHFGRVGEAGSVHDVMLYRIDDHQHLRETVYAQQGRYRPDARPPRWRLEQVRRTRFVPAGEDDRPRTETEQLPHLDWETIISPDILGGEIRLASEKRPLAELSRKISYLQRQQLDAGRYQLAWWRKALQPLASVALVMLAISFVFGPLREVSMGNRIVVGLVLGIGFKFVQDLLAPASSVYGFAPIVAAALPIIISLGIGLVLLRRVG